MALSTEYKLLPVDLFRLNYRLAANLTERVDQADADFLQHSHNDSQSRLVRVPAACDLPRGQTRRCHGAIDRLASTVDDRDSDADVEESGGRPQARIGGGRVFHRAAAEFDHDHLAALRAQPLDGGRERFGGWRGLGHLSNLTILGISEKHMVCSCVGGVNVPTMPPAVTFPVNCCGSPTVWI